MDKNKLQNCACPFVATLSVIGGKYKLEIIYYLFDRTLRYGQIAKHVKSSHKMLAQQLKELEADGIIKRTVYPVVPPKTEYSLTPLGNKLSAAVLEMYKFGQTLFDINQVKEPCSAENFVRLKKVLNEMQD